jgi:hypothetical protein
MRWRFRDGGWWVGCAIAAIGSCAPEVDEEIHDETIDRWIELYCEGRTACECGDAQETDVCTQSQETTWEARRRAASSRGLVYDGDCVASDVEALEGAACEWPEAGADHECHAYCAIFHGDRDVLESCEAYDDRTSDCAHGLLCASGTCVDPCTVLTGLGAGEVCRGPSGDELDRCADGLVCSFDTNRCGTGLDAGASCYDGGLCGEGLYCAYDEFGGSAFCTPEPQAGQPCGNGGQCGEGLQCDWNTALCRGPAALGESCESVSCEQGLVCDFSINACAVPPALGQPCPFGDCAEGSWCDNSIMPQALCVAVAPDGQPCTGHSRCESGYCPAGYCLPRPALGENCSELFVCAEGLACDGATCKPSRTKGPAVCVYDGW